MSNNIASERVRAGLSREQLAKEFGVGPTSVMRWENGTSVPTTATVVKLADRFGCSIDYLLALTDERLRR